MRRDSPTCRLWKAVMYQRSKVVFMPSACSESVKNSPVREHSNRPASNA